MHAVAGGAVWPNVAAAVIACVAPLVWTAVSACCPKKSPCPLTDVGPFAIFPTSLLTPIPALKISPVFPLDCPKKLDAFASTLTCGAGEATLAGTSAGEADLTGTGEGALAEGGGTFPNRLDAFKIFPTVIGIGTGTGDDDRIVGGSGDADLISRVVGVDAEYPNISAADLTDLVGDG